jgi:hypothetical protein
MSYLAQICNHASRDIAAGEMTEYRPDSQGSILGRNTKSPPSQEIQTGSGGRLFSYLLKNMGRAALA